MGKEITADDIYTISGRIRGARLQNDEIALAAAKRDLIIAQAKLKIRNADRMRKEAEQTLAEYEYGDAS